MKEWIHRYIADKTISKKARTLETKTSCAENTSNIDDLAEIETW